MPECPTCKMYFNSKDKLKTHINKKNKCSPFDYENEFKKLEKERDKSFPCDKCEKKFSTKAHLQKHKKAIITQCFLSQLTGQIENIQNINESKKILCQKKYKSCGDKFICERCEFKFSTKAHLQKHENSKLTPCYILYQQKIIGECTTNDNKSNTKLD